MIPIRWSHFCGPQSRRLENQDQLKQTKEASEGKDKKCALKNRNNLEAREEVYASQEERNKTEVGKQWESRFRNTNGFR